MLSTEDSIIDKLHESSSLLLDKGTHIIKDFTGSLEDDRITLTGSFVNLYTGKIVNYTKSQGKTSLLVTGMAQLGTVKNALVRICGKSYPVISTDKDRIILIGEINIPDCSEYSLIDIETVVKFENMLLEDGSINLRNLVIAGNFKSVRCKVSMFNVIVVDRVDIRYGSLTIMESSINTAKVETKHSRLTIEGIYVKNSDFLLRYSKNHIKRCVCNRSDIRVASGFTYLRRITGMDVIASDAACVDVKDMANGEIHTSANSTVIKH